MFYLKAFLLRFTMPSAKSSVIPSVVEARPNGCLSEHQSALPEETDDMSYKIR